MAFTHELVNFYPFKDNFTNRKNYFIVAKRLVYLIQF